MAPPSPLPMGLMAGMCKAMISNPGPTLMLSIPGAVLVILGLMVLVEPRVLPWRAALVPVAAALGLPMFARVLRGGRAQGLAG